MDFGLMFSFVVAGDQTNMDAYREMDTLLPLAEELGFTSFHTTEHHFLADGWAPSPLMVLAKAAGLTKTMRLATNILIVPLYHPLRLAEDLAVLDNLSDGRVSVGLAPGYASEELKAFDVPMDQRVGRFEETIDILQLAWKGEPFSWQGKYFTIPWAHLVPSPVQETLPIWYGVSGPKLLKRAAERRLPVTASPRHTITELKAHFDRYGTVAAESDYKPEERPVIREVFIAPTVEEAEALAGPAITEMFSLYGMKSAQGERDLTNDAGELITNEGQVDFRTFSSRYIVGDPESAIAQIRHLRDEVAPTTLVCRMQLPGVSSDHFERSLRMFAEHVMPAFGED